MRAVGAVFIFIFFSLLGVFRGEKEKERLAECEAFLELFEYIKNQINYFLTPTKVMYRNFSNAVLEKNGFLPALRSHEGDEVYCDIWRTSFESCKKNICLSEKQRALALAFGDCIGKTNAPVQTKSFDYYIAEMSDEISKQRTESAKNAKLYRTLGMAAGALAAILVI